MEHQTNTSEASTAQPGDVLDNDDCTRLLVEAGELLPQIEGMPHLAPLVSLLVKLLLAVSVMRAEQCRAVV